jgi:hypothetical protein
VFRRRRPLQGMRRRSSAVMGRTRRTVRGCRSHPPGRFRCWPAPPEERRSDHCLPAPRLMGSPTSLHCTNCSRTLRFRGRSRHRACPQVPWQLAHGVPRRLREHPRGSIESPDAPVDPDTRTCRPPGPHGHDGAGRIALLSRQTTRTSRSDRTAPDSCHLPHKGRSVRRDGTAGVESALDY